MEPAGLTKEAEKQLEDAGEGNPATADVTMPPFTLGPSFQITPRRQGKRMAGGSRQKRTQGTVRSKAQGTAGDKLSIWRASQRGMGKHSNLSGSGGWGTRASPGGRLKPHTQPPGVHALLGSTCL